MPGGRGGALVALLLVNLMWGSTLPMSKLAFADFSPLALSALRLSLAALPLLGWAALRGQLWPPPAPLRLLMPLGLLAMGGNIALLYLSLVQTSDTGKNDASESITYAVDPGVYFLKVKDTRDRESNFVDSYAIHVEAP